MSVKVSADTRRFTPELIAKVKAAAEEAEKTLDLKAKLRVEDFNEFQAGLTRITKRFKKDRADLEAFAAASMESKYKNAIERISLQMEKQYIDSTARVLVSDEQKRRALDAKIIADRERKEIAAAVRVVNDTGKLIEAQDRKRDRTRLQNEIRQLDILVNEARIAGVAIGEALALDPEKGRLKRGFTRLKQGFTTIINDIDQITTIGGKRIGVTLTDGVEREFRVGGKRIGATFGTLLTKALTAPVSKIGKSFSAGFKNLDNEVKLLIALAPALAPLIAGLAAGAAGLAALAGAGAIAAVGIKQLVDNGDELGTVFVERLNTLRTAFDGMAQSAARAAAPGLLDAMDRLTKGIAASGPLVDQLAGSFGRTADSLTTGLVEGFRTFAPLLNQVAGAVERTAAGFAEWAGGPGGREFARGLSDGFTVLGDVMSHLGPATTALGAALFEVGEAIAPVLNTVLDVIKSVSDGINAIFKQEGFQALVRGFQQAFKEVGDAVEPLVDAFVNLFDALGPVFRVLGPVIGFLGKLLALPFKALAGALNLVAGGFRLIGKVGGFVKGLFGGGKKEVEQVIQPLRDLDGALTDLTRPALLSRKVELEAFAAQFKNVKPNDDQKQQLAEVAAELDQINGLLSPTATNQIREYTVALTGMGSSLPTEGLRDLAEAASEFAAAQGDVVKQGELFRAGLSVLRGETLNTAGTMLEAVAAIGDVETALEDLGGNSARALADIKLLGAGETDLSKINKTLAPDTLKLNQALLGYGDAALDAAEQAFRLNGGFNNTKVAVGEANKVLDGLAIQLAQKMKPGFSGTAEEARKYADSVGAIPNRAETELLFKDGDATRILKDIRDVLVAIAKTFNVNVNLETGEAEKALTNLTQPRTVIIRTQSVTPGSSGFVRAEASGGFISGPGTGTSDSILARLSNGEYVIKARSVAKYGLAFLDAINRGTASFARGGLAKFAQGGQVQRFATGGKVKQRVNPLIPIAKRLFVDVSLRLRKGELDELIGEFRSFIGSARARGNNRLAALLTQQNNKLLALSQRRERIQAQLEAAQDRLRDLVEQRGDFKLSVADAITGSFDLLSASGEKASFDALIKDLRSTVQDALKFRGDLNKLADLGLNKDALAQLAQAGPEAAAATVTALLSEGKSGVSEFNRLFGQLNTTARQAGHDMASVMFDAGVEAAKGLVEGLKDQDAALAAQMKALARVMIDEIKTVLKIKSPSRVMFGLGESTGEGFARGVASQSVTVSQASGALSNGVVSGVQGAGSAGVPSVEISQNFYGPVTNGARLREMKWAAQYGTANRVERWPGVAR